MQKFGKSFAGEFHIFQESLLARQLIEFLFHLSWENGNLVLGSLNGWSIAEEVVFQDVEVY